MKMLKSSWIALIIPLVYTLITTTSYCQDPAQGFSRKEFYTILASQNIQQVDAQLEILKKSKLNEKNAYAATLIMKKAGLIKNPAKKLNLFREGHKKLESAIAKDRENGELRFLRLMIQEKAPAMLGYKDDLQNDSAYIRQSFKKLPVDVQQAITDYSKTSKVLRSEDF